MSFLLKWPTQYDALHFVFGREPKFELVYDNFTTIPLVQFALGTNLSQQEMEKLLPEPNGFSIPGLDKIFRSVMISSPWTKLGFRLDLYFKDTSRENEWSTGEWLIKSGGRIQI